MTLQLLVISRSMAHEQWGVGRIIRPRTRR